MTDKELQKLKRPELLEIMLNLKSELDSQKAENEELRKKLDEKTIALEKSGSIAEASLELSGIFGAAQEAADVYLNNVKKMHADQEVIYNNSIADAKREAENIVSQAQKEANNLKTKTDIECRSKIKMTDEECEKKILDTNNMCREKIKEVNEKCKAISSLNSHIASFFGDDGVNDVTPVNTSE